MLEVAAERYMVSQEPSRLSELSSPHRVDRLEARKHVVAGREVEGRSCLKLR